MHSREQTNEPTWHRSTRIIRRQHPLIREFKRKWRRVGASHSATRTQATILWAGEPSEAVREAAESVADLIGADADEVVFTSGATESNNLALQGLARRAPEGRDRILVSAIEHKCVLAAARALISESGYHCRNDSGRSPRVCGFRFIGEARRRTRTPGLNDGRQQ